MLTPRLTNCQDCDKIPDLLKSIDCKLAEFGSNMYNNVVYMLNQPIPATTMLQLLAYKRILTYKYCNPHYAGQCSVNDIAGKVIRLTAGCVSRCNEPTVCEITTCYVTVVPNPSTTTTSTSSTSSTTTTTTSTSSTTTTTTTIYPDCRIEGCFEELTTTTTTSSTSSTTTTTTTVADIPVTGNSYFTFWSDTSGSMDDTIEVTAQIASVTGVKSLVSPTVLAGSTVINLTNGNQNNKVTESAPGGDTTSKAYLCIVDGMEAIHPAIPAGTFVVRSAVLEFDLVDSGGNPVSTTADIIQGANGIITFNLTNAQKSADYVNTSNLRNLLQDFYATAGTEASGNTDRATNGSDEFEARVYWCHSSVERQISMLSNKGLGGTIDVAGYFPDADSLAIMAFGDESGSGYNMDGDFPAAGNAWENRDVLTNARITEDIQNVRDFVEGIETAAGNTDIYRAKFFHPEATYGYIFSTIKPLVSPTGLLNAGINGADVLTSYNAGQPGQPASKPASAYSITLQDFPSASPARFAWSADLDNSPANPQQYWYDEIRNALIAFGYGV
jgi:hypothetical protein